MKIFISWSGPLSRQIAEILRDWLPSVLQTVKPYVSSEDIYKGARWSVEVSHELEVANYGILCITATNIQAPWLNFEAGALSKSLEKGRVSPFLFDIEPSNMPPGPLLQFQSTVYERDDLLKLIESINEVIEAPLEPVRLHKAFEMWWPELQAKLDNAKSSTPLQDQSAAAERPVEEMVAELLDLARAGQRKLLELDQRAPRQFVSTIELGTLRDILRALFDQGVSTEDLAKAIPPDTWNLLGKWIKENQSQSPTEAMNADLKSSDD